MPPTDQRDEPGRPGAAGPARFAERGGAVRAADRRGHAPRPVRLEFQLWTWDFAGDPDDPQRGVLVDRYVYAVDPLRPGRGRP